MLRFTISYFANAMKVINVLSSFYFFNNDWFVNSWKLIKALIASGTSATNINSPSSL